MQETLISVIIPVYNVEKYLDRCVESIVNQTYRNLEIILVDDGSPDRCPEMCDEWAKKDGRIKVIHQKNGGAGKARNTGTQLATGSFISYVDSDDYVDKYFYEKMTKLFDEETDVVECEYVSVNDENVVFEINGEVWETTAEKAMEYHIKDTYFKQVIWNKLYRHSVVKDIYFPIDKMIDDEFWTYQVLGNCRKLKHFDDVLYAYRQQENSVMHETFSIKRLQALEAKTLRLKYVDKNYKKLLFVAKNDLWLTCVYMGQMSLEHFSKDDSRKAFEYINDILRFCKFSKNDMKQLRFTYKVWALVTRISIKMACRLRNWMNIGL